MTAGVVVNVGRGVSVGKAYKNVGNVGAEINVPVGNGVRVWVRVGGEKIAVCVPAAAAVCAMGVPNDSGPTGCGTWVEAPNAGTAQASKDKLAKNKTIFRLTRDPNI
jgi:hypothetical protein